MRHGEETPLGVAAMLRLRPLTMAMALVLTGCAASYQTGVHGLTEDAQLAEPGDGGNWACYGRTYD